MKFHLFATESLPTFCQFNADATAIRLALDAVRALQYHQPD